MSDPAPNTLEGARSVWFAGGHNQAALEAALASEADAVMADFEDMVPAGSKEVARQIVRRLFAKADGRQLLIVRINGSDTEDQADDLAALAHVSVGAVMVPKATPQAVEALGADGPGVIALIESAEGVRLAYEIASLDRVKAFMIGTADLGRDLRIEPTPMALLYTCSKLVVDAAAAGIRAPFDIPSPSVGEVLAQECADARALGMRGKLCMSDEQVTIINDAFGAI